MAQTRMIRTIIRATEEEARRLHEIAERQNIYIAKLIRECTLAPSMKPWRKRTWDGLKEAGFFRKQWSGKPE